ncbi:glycosyltransferase family 2 protein [Oceanicoccus sp. KOV_DT_Chl]|uniref:glycosyltransferase family 2 protein n=1 Tax=Oceanicoccus sp. KOV_DT_Chl TaxID=1904639 RepID=UPI000C7B259C|nr:glycosyltransferase family 2 protein [Oceanicoccus sp. KOV_DT_Chl]
MLVSVVIRTLNEEKHLDELLSAINEQESDIFEIETVIVDSGSTDRTLAIAEAHQARITHIKKEEFSFGRSLNIGCSFACGEILIFVSGHCIPVEPTWLHALCVPIYEGKVQYSYGRQIGRDNTKFSERQVFDKYFPAYSMVPQSGFFCNNANAALLRSSWQEFQFDEDLTGLEDMHLAKKLVESGGLVAYISSAPVFHIHDESWAQVRRRYEREAIALQKINPEIHMTFTDFMRCFISSCLSDMGIALRKKIFLKEIKDIYLFRFLQYWGGYQGNHIHRKLSLQAKRKYFYPNEKVTSHLEVESDNEKNYRVNAAKSK